MVGILVLYGELVITITNDRVPSSDAKCMPKVVCCTYGNSSSSIIKLM